MTTCIFTADSSIQHDTGPGHPECPERIPSITNGLKKIQTPKLIWKNVGSFNIGTKRKNILKKLINHFQKKV